MSRAFSAFIDGLFDADGLVLGFWGDGDQQISGVVFDARGDRMNLGPADGFDDEGPVGNDGVDATVDPDLLQESILIGQMEGYAVVFRLSGVWMQVEELAERPSVGGSRGGC